MNPPTTRDYDLAREMKREIAIRLAREHCAMTGHKWVERGYARTCEYCGREEYWMWLEGWQ